ncbi:hypothetical protein MNY58_00600 [Staphylococcus edaphicus]|uniref:Glycine zipper family protein n=1 Tax=Staphylococcus edaphicus TaxID=1955013 RepID=A0ABY4QDZ4_9STAP|nr:hypothetical protein [Staphylococcus edaphicus]UQW81647.1 hypothetical protein MNY58_00600 [Staphylococcus edaphicus]
MIKNGKTIAKVGKFGGTTMIGVGFGLGMYDDLKNENKTVGEATAHNTLTTGAGIGASLAAGVGITFLVSNPAGWAVLGGIAIGAGVAFGADIMYQNNTLGLKDGVDWTGHQIDKGIKGYTNLLRKKNKLESQAVDFTANQIKSSYNSLKPKISDLQNDVGASIKEVKKSVNPMKWSW